MKSVMKHDFSRIPSTSIERSTFDRSHGVKTCFDEGYLVPIYVDEVLPGDTFKLDANLLVKIMPTVSDFFDNVFLDVHWFYCPSRLLWTNFTKMMGERVNPNDSIDYTVPQIVSPNSTTVESENGFDFGSLADYLGVPPKVRALSVNALPFRMYAKVWDDWYRDENLQNSIIQSSADLGDGVGTIAWNTLRKRGKRHDYFTSCLPWPQKGEGVEIPLGGSAPVDGTVGLNFVGTFSETALKGQKLSGGESSVYPSGSPNNKLSATLDATADLSEATAVTINSLRMAFQIQRLLEADARGGTRYVEIIRNHFKTICPDARLQRSEYLGGNTLPIVWDKISNTYGETNLQPAIAHYPLGYRVLYGNTFGKSGFVKSFTEHGYVMCLVSVRADLNYQQGLNRLWSRKGRYDFYWPTLAHLGEQAVLNKEIYAQGNRRDSEGNLIDDKVFGYQERYAEYRYHPSMITGQLRSMYQSGDDTTLDFMHLAQKFTELPVLNSSFIEENPPLSRVLSVPNEPHIFLDGYISCICTRPMPTYSVPGLIDHL